MGDEGGELARRRLPLRQRQRFFAAFDRLRVLAQAREPYESSYEPRAAEPVVFRNVSVYTGDGATLPPTDVHIAGEGTLLVDVMSLAGLHIIKTHI